MLPLIFLGISLTINGSSEDNMKYSVLFVSLLFMQIILSPLAHAKSRPDRPDFTPPFPAQRPPYNQDEYEKTLPVEQQKWIRQTADFIRQNNAKKKNHLAGFTCAFVLNKNGKLDGPVFFSQEPEKKEQITKWIQALSLQKLPTGMDQTGVTLKIDVNSNVAIRFYD